MTKPTKPSIPLAPLRTAPSTFSDRAETFFRSFQDFVNYLAESNDWTKEQADAALAAAVLGNLSGLDLSALAGQAVGVNAAGDAIEGKSLTANVAIATKAQAEAGTDNSVSMSPLRTKQSIDKFAPGVSGRTKLSTKTASNSASITFQNEFNSSVYTDYEFHIRNIQVSVDNARFQISPSADGGNTNTNNNYEGRSFITRSGYSSLPIQTKDIGNGTNETGLSAILTVFDLHADKGAHFICRGVFSEDGNDIDYIQTAGALQRPSTDSPINHIGFSASTGNLASGTIVLYGIPS